MHRFSSFSLFGGLMVLAIVTQADAQNKRDTAVRDDKQTVSQDESWYYDDLQTALNEAREAQRPLMIVFR